MIHKHKQPNRRILIVDDQAAIHGDFKSILVPEDVSTEGIDAAAGSFLGETREPVEDAWEFEVDSAFQGKEALKMVKQGVESGLPYAMAFVDIRMPPGWDGIETIRNLWKVSPDLEVVICSAYSDYSWQEVTKELGRSDQLLILKKPFDNVEISQLAYALTKKWNITSERKQAERKNLQYAVELESTNRSLVELSEAANAANRAKSEFLTNMSHELRTPLNSLLILSKLLAKNERRNLTLDQVTSASIIHSGGQDLLVLINDILDLARIESGRLEVRISSVNIRDLADRLLKQFSPVAEQSELNLEIIVNDSLPEALSTDGQKLEQILRNLLSNALKFTEAGAVTLNIGPPHGNAPFSRQNLNLNETIAFSVTDTGIGIPLEMQECIFESFQQVDGSTTRKYGGTGLGLTISRKFALTIKGEIQLQSTENEGSTFTLFLPLKSQIEPSAAAEPTSTLSLATSSRSHHATMNLDDIAASLSEADHPGNTNDIRTSLPNAAEPLTGKKVLVVDDDRRNLFAMFKVLEARGTQVVLADNGQLALDLLQKEGDVDLVIMDVMMPGMDGLETTRAIRAQRKYDGLTIIALTAKAMPGDQEKCMTAGASAYVSKPVEMEDLLAEVRTWLPEKEPQGSSLS